MIEEGKNQLRCPTLVVKNKRKRDQAVMIVGFSKEVWRTYLEAEEEEAGLGVSASFSGRF
jgi:hypothetical protein